MPRPEHSFRTPAIILKRRDFGEADRLLTVLTPMYGKLDVIAKGARKPTSHKTGHVELFTRADMLIHRGRDFHLVEQAEMVAPYLALRENLQRGAYANYVAELLDRFIVSDEENPPLFQLLDETLGRLCSEKDPRLPVRYFEVQLLSLAGYRPELNECIVDREPVQPVEQYFSYADGGVVCPEHALQNPTLISLPMVTLKLMRHMQRSPYQQVKSLQLSGAIHDDAERVLLGYITYLLERKLQSVDFIRRLKR